jgi:hypothetical protein
MFVIGPSFRGYTTATLAEKLWNLHVACAACRTCGLFRAVDVIEQFGPNATVGEIMDRLTCSACGGRDGTGMLMQAMGETQACDVARFNQSKKYEQ